MSEDWMRRRDISRMTKEELSIHVAMLQVEAMDAHELLTDASFLLMEAQEKLADYIDLQLKQAEEHRS